MPTKERRFWTRDVRLLLVYTVVVAVSYSRLPPLWQPGVIRLTAAFYFGILFLRTVGVFQDIVEPELKAGSEHRGPSERRRLWHRRRAPFVIQEQTDWSDSITIVGKNPKYLSKMLSRLAVPEEKAAHILQQMQAKKHLSLDEIAEVTKEVEEIV